MAKHEIVLPGEKPVSHATQRRITLEFLGLLAAGGGALVLNKGLKRLNETLALMDGPTQTPTSRTDGIGTRVPNTSQPTDEIYSSATPWNTATVEPTKPFNPTETPFPTKEKSREVEIPPIKDGRVTFIRIGLCAPTPEGLGATEDPEVSALLLRYFWEANMNRFSGKKGPITRFHKYFQGSGEYGNIPYLEALLSKKNPEYSDLVNRWNTEGKMMPYHAKGKINGKVVEADFKILRTGLVPGQLRWEPLAAAVGGRNDDVFNGDGIYAGTYTENQQNLYKPWLDRIKGKPEMVTDADGSQTIGLGLQPGPDGVDRLIMIAGSHHKIMSDYYKNMAMWGDPQVKYLRIPQIYFMALIEAMGNKRGSGDWAYLRPMDKQAPYSGTTYILNGSLLRV